MIYKLMFVLGVGLGFLRPVFVFKPFGKHASQSYQAASHIVVGWLFAMWYVNNDSSSGWLLLSLTSVEIVCALMTLSKKS